MPAQFRYLVDEQPPAAYALVDLANLDGKSTRMGVPAKLDTGADRTVFPLSLIEELNFDEIGNRTFEGLGGERIELPIFRCRVGIDGCSEYVIDAAASEGESTILLGRDLLNQFRITFDGPKQILVIE